MKKMHPAESATANASESDKKKHGQSCAVGAPPRLAKEESKKKDVNWLPSRELTYPPKMAF